MIEVRNLTKRYGDVLAVDDMSFTVEPGIVTGFLGPNGAGKSTTMRMILGLDRPTSGTATVNGHPYVESASPLAEMGALLEARAIDKGRSARNHLLALGATIGVGASARRPPARGRRPRRRREQGRRRVLPGHGPAPGHRDRAARRPADGDARRAGQRPGPRRHPVDPHPAQGPGGRGPHGVRVLAPDERDGDDRRAPRGRRAGQGAGGRVDGRLHRSVLAERRPGGVPRRRPAHPPARRPRRHRHLATPPATWRSPGCRPHGSASWPPGRGSCSTSSSTSPPRSRRPSWS